MPTFFSIFLHRCLQLLWRLTCVSICWGDGINYISNFSAENICRLQQSGGWCQRAGVKNVKTLGDDYVHCVPIIVQGHRLQEQYGTCEGRLQRDYSSGGDTTVRKAQLRRHSCALLLQRASMVTKQWLWLGGHWVQNWICIPSNVLVKIVFKKNKNISVKDEKKIDIWFARRV